MACQDAVCEGPHTVSSRVKPTASAASLRSGTGGTKSPEPTRRTGAGGGTTVAKKPGPATSSSSSSGSAASANPAKRTVAKKDAVPMPTPAVAAAVATVDAATSTAEDGSATAEVDETAEDSVVALKTRLALVLESEQQLKQSLDARDIEFYMLQSEADELRQQTENVKSSFASELNSESVFSKLEAENQSLQRQLAALRREKDDAMQEMQLEMRTMTSSLQDDMEAQTASLSSENSTLKSQLVSQTAQIQSLLQDISHFKESNHAKDFELARSARDYLALQQQIDRAGLVEAAKADELLFAREGIESGRTRIRELEAHLESCLGELKLVKTELLGLVNSGVKVAAGTELLDKIKGLEEARSKDQQALTSLEKRMVELSQERDALVHQVEQANKDADNFMSAAAAANAAVKAAEAKLAAAEAAAAAAIASASAATVMGSEVVAVNEVKLDDASGTEPASVHWAAAKAAELEVELQAVRKSVEEEKASAVESASALFESEKANLLKELADLRSIHEIRVKELQEELEKAVVVSPAVAAEPSISDPAASLIVDAPLSSATVQELETRLVAIESDFIAAQDENKAQMTQYTQEKAALLSQIDHLKESLQHRVQHELSDTIESLKAASEAEKTTAVNAAIASLEEEKAALTAELAQLRAVTATVTRSDPDAANDAANDTTALDLLQRATQAERELAAAQTQITELTAHVHGGPADTAVAGDAGTAGLEKEIQTLRATREKDLKYVEVLQRSIAEKEESIDNKISAIEAELKTAQAFGSMQESRAADLEGRLLEAEAELSALQMQHNVSMTENYAYVDKMSELETEIAGLRSDLEQCNDNLSSLSSTHTALVEQHSALMKKEKDVIEGTVQEAPGVTNVNTEALAQLRVKLDGAQSRIQALENDLKEAGLKITSLETQLNAVVGNSTAEYLESRKEALDVNKTDAERLYSYEKVVAELEVQLVTADFRASQKFAKQ
ncbi:hypothetical protein BC830DRAFT_1085415 [Chytriomyces sp. MP71]|nr:hypothetical protein BC830DRAFT_1085415 [Chytriomyces sp. MP71]